MWAALSGWVDALLQLSQSWSCWAVLFGLLALLYMLRDGKYALATYLLSDAVREEADPDPHEPADRINTNTQPFREKGA